MITLSQVGAAFRAAGQYRVQRALEIAGEGAPDGVSGSLLLALGLRETGLRNVQGGAKQVDGRWVALSAGDWRLMDVGALQISRRYHADALKRMPAVKAGTWGPVAPGHTPYEYGYVPRWTDALRFTIDELHENTAYAMEHGILGAAATRFAVAAHNAGAGGALAGHRAGDVDRWTAHGDYSEWVLAARTVVNQWLGQHPGWKAAPSKR